MKHFTQLWFDQNIPIWDRVLAEFKGKPKLNFLEIGCFEGRATLWLMENVLTNPTSKMTVIDTFKGSPEHYNIDLSKLREHFDKNLFEYKERLTVWDGVSKDILPVAIARKKRFDFIYIDGSHMAFDVLRDAVYSWDLLKEEGIMIFDDFRWGEIEQVPVQYRPYSAITAFYNVIKDKVQEISYPDLKNDQVVLKKLAGVI